MTTTKTTVKTKVIDDETRVEAANYVAAQVETCSAYKREDLRQEAWIILEGRMGQPFHSSVSFATGDLRRKIYGRDMKEHNFYSKWLLKFGSFNYDEKDFIARCTDSNEIKRTDLKSSVEKRLRLDPYSYFNNLEREDIYNELLLFSRSIKKEDAFVVLANFDNPVPVLKDLRETTTEGAEQRLTLLRRAIKKKYDLDFFND